MGDEPLEATTTQPTEAAPSLATPPHDPPSTATATATAGQLPSVGDESVGVRAAKGAGSTSDQEDGGAAVGQSTEQQAGEGERVTPASAGEGAMIQGVAAGEQAASGGDHVQQQQSTAVEQEAATRATAQATSSSSSASTAVGVESPAVGAGGASIVIEPATSTPATSTSAAATPTLVAPLPSNTLTSTLPAPPVSAPSPSVSPAPTTKKFQSSLSVNKKFLEKAGDSKAKEQPKVAIARLATPPIPTPVSASHPRLLTGKISSSSAAPPSSSSPAPSGTPGSNHAPGATGATGAPTGWLKSAAPTAMPLEAVVSPPAGVYERGRRMMGLSGGQQRGAGASGMWGRGGNASYGPGGEFPTAAEAANAKNLRAQAIAEQLQSRDRAVQARAAAAAAANAHLLEGLDAFRGVHLDPNASHWDEDVDDDFLDDTIEFGDGTQYKLSEDTAPPPARPPAGARADDLTEPHPSEFAKREAPLAAGEAAEPPMSREERFKDDYDRSYKKPAAASSSHHPHPGADPARNLFNERLGKFEPYAGGAGAGRRTSVSAGLSELPPHLESSRHPHPPASARRPSVTSPRLLDKAPLPPPNAWGAPRGPALGGRRPSIEHHAHAPPPHASARRPSNELGGRRPSMEMGARRPSVGAADASLGGRQLPPHLMAQAARGGPPPPPPSSARRPSLILSPPRAPAAHLPPIAGSPAPAPPVIATALPAAEATPQPPTTEDLEALHLREMHAAAERAKKRRQEEEQARDEQKARAKKKAEELEEKLRLAEEAKRPPAPVNGAAAVAAPSATSAPPPPTERVDSWRKPLPPSVIAPPPGAAAHPTVSSASASTPTSTAAAAPAPPKAAPTPVVRPEPTRILTREPQPPAAAAAAPAKAPLPSLQPAVPSQDAAPRAHLVPQDRAWRRAEQVPAPALPPTGPPRATPTAPADARQLPPHLAHDRSGAGSQATSRAEPSRLTPAAVASAGGRPADSYVRPTPAPVASEPSPTPATSAPAPVVVPPTPQAVEPATAAKELSVATASSLQAARKAGASTPTTAAKEKAGYKVPEVSQFDDLMSRIKGAMNAPAPPKTPTPRLADNAETVSTSHSSPRGDVPTVKLPAPSASAVAPSSSNVPTPAPSPPILTSKPPVPTEPRSAKPAATTNGGAQSQPRGREVQPRKVSTRAAFESREALPLFERTRAARSPSPTPAWKRYSVQLSSSAQVAPRRPPSLPSLKLFHSTHSPAKVNILSWNPPIVNLSTRRMSRDDLFFPKKYVRGKVICPVKMPSKRIEKRRDIELVERKVRMAKAVAEEKKAPKEEGKEVGQGKEEAAGQEGMVDGSGRAPTPRGRGRGRAPEQGLWRRESPLPSPAAVEVDQPQLKELGAAAAEDTPGELDSTTAPPAAELFSTSPSQPRESKMGPASIAFYRSADGGRPSPLERSFMVTSELDGEVVNMGPRESLAAPGADRSSSASMDPAQKPAFDAPSSSWNSKPPLSLSVLDPTAPSVWSSPLSDKPVHSRSISLGAPKQENSLQGIADDDFPAAIPSSLADLKSEDEGSTKDDGVKRFVPNKDEARLRAAAPSFSSFNPQAGAFEASRPALAPSYPSFGRQSQVSPVPLTYPSLTGGGPSPSPSFSPAPLSHNLAGGYSHAAPHQQQQQQQYPSLGLTSQSPTGFPASYGVGQQQQHHPSYSPLPFAPSPQQQHHQHLGASPSPQPLYQQQYRSPVGPPQGITNPALIANYGYGAVGGAFGAVGAGNRGVVGGPGGYGRSPAPSPYSGVSQGGYRDASSSFAGSPQDARSPLPFMGGGGPGGHGVGGSAGGMGASSGGYGGLSPVMMPQHLPPHHSPFLQHQQAPYGGGAGAAQFSPQMQGGRVGGAGGVGGPVQQGYRRGQW